MNDLYYRLPTQRIGQGDILVDVPSLRILNPRIEFARRRQTQRGPLADLWELDAARQPQQAIDLNNDEALAAIQVAHCMIVGNACDWDNRPTAPVPVALVRPLSTLPADQWDIVRNNANGRLLHLPENDHPPFAESYVDFARVTAIRADVLPTYARLLSPTAELLIAFYIASAYATSRLDLDKAAARGAAEKAAREADEPAEV